MAEERQVNIELGANISPKASREFSKLQKTAKRLGRAFKASFRAFKTVAIPALAVTGGILAVSVRRANAFAKGMAEIATLVDTSKVNMKEFANEVLNLSSSSGIDVLEVQLGLYQTLSFAILDASESMDFLEKSSRTAIAGVASLEDAVKLTLSVMGAYGKETFKIARIQDVAFKTVQLGVTTFSKLADSIGTVLPFSSQLDVSIEEIFASLIALTKSGLDTAKSFTFLKGLFVQILKPSKQAAAAADKMGISFDLAHFKTIKLSGFLKELQIATKGSADKMAELFPESQALAAALTLAGKQSETFTGGLEGLLKATGAVNEGFAKVKEAKKFDDALNAIGNTSIRIGAVVLPIITEGLEALADKFKKWDEDGTLELWLSNFKDWVNRVKVVVGVFKILFSGLKENIGIALGTTGEIDDEARFFENLASISKKEGDEKQALFFFKKAGEARNREQASIVGPGEEREESQRGLVRNLAAIGVERKVIEERMEKRKFDTDRFKQQGKNFSDEFDQHVQQAIDDFRLNIGIGLRQKKAGDLVRAP